MDILVCSKLGEKDDVTFPLCIRFKGEEKSFCGKSGFNWYDLKYRWSFRDHLTDHLFCKKCLSISTFIENL